MTVESAIKIYEFDGKEDVHGLLSISSHWNYHDFVVIDCGGQKITVAADDLIKAVKNATNW